MKRIAVLLALGLVAVAPIASQAQTPTDAKPAAPALKKPVAAPKVKVSMKKAESVVLKKYPGKLAGKTELENEEGKWEYAVMVRSGKTLREVMVNAVTGKIDDVEVTTDEKEAKEKRDEEAAAKKKMESEKKGESDEKDEKDEADEKKPTKP